MEFFRFLQTESQALDRRLLLIGAFAGMLHMFVIFTLTITAGKAAAHESNVWPLSQALLAIWLFWLSQDLVMRRVTAIIEDIVEKIRLRIAQKLRDSDLASIEHLGSAAPYNLISRHAMAISQAARGVVGWFVAVATLTFASIGILYVSLTSFLILSVTLAFVIAVLKANNSKIEAYLAAAIQDDNKFVDSFGNLMDGFKELKMNSAKSADFFNSELKPLADSTKRIRIQAGLVFNRGVLMFICTPLITLTALILLLPLLSPPEIPKLVQLTTFVIFIFGPLGQAIGFYPALNEAVASINEIRRVEQTLDTFREERLAESSLEPVIATPFRAVQCSKLSFTYRDEHGNPLFSLAPLEFELSAGELVFITGGNGTGKSTFLKVLAGLYAPAAGTIAVNGIPVAANNRQSYRNLFSAIFSDYHLFHRAYGIEEIDQNRANSLLDMLGLLHKTSIVGKVITSIDLSAGERKRLALALALLEDKPILLLDEWAAEQDRQFRQKFYREVLPWLKNEGKTVLAVSHDDEYYNVADRVLRMKFGSFV
jgi:putative ATP-binding cassette transporter